MEETLTCRPHLLQRCSLVASYLGPMFLTNHQQQQQQQQQHPPPQPPPSSWMLSPNPHPHLQPHKETEPVLHPRFSKTTRPRD